MKSPSLCEDETRVLTLTVPIGSDLTSLDKSDMVNDREGTFGTYNIKYDNEFTTFINESAIEIFLAYLYLKIKYIGSVLRDRFWSRRSMLAGFGGPFDAVKSIIVQVV